MIGDSCSLSLGRSGACILSASFPLSSLRRLIKANAAETLIFEGAAVAFLIELVLLNVDAVGAIPHATVVLGLET